MWRYVRGVVVGSAVLIAVTVAAAECHVPDDHPRTLVLALDGIPLRLVEQARDEGAFASWAPPRPLVSTFPSVTNVAFTAMFSPFGVEPAGGYEVQFFDWARNTVVGGSLWGYTDNLFAWRGEFDVTGKTVGGKLSVYTSPGGNIWKEVDEAERLILEAEQELVLVHVGATDAMLHLRGDKAVLAVLLELDARIEALRARYEAERGGPLGLVLLSDHGNTKIKVKSADGVRKKLKKAGLRPWPHLEEENDVVAATFGILNYGVLFTRPENGERAAEAMVQHKTVALAAWRSGPSEVSVVLKAGGKGAKTHLGRIRWRDAGSERLYAYSHEHGDPLDLDEAVERMRAAGSIDAEGFAPERAWLDASIDSGYPNAPRRLTDALAGNFVANTASVIFSLKPGYGWGWQSAYASSFIWGGRLEGTHGGLDRDSSIGFYMSDHEQPGLPRVLSVTDVLEPFADLERCRPSGTHVTERQAADDLGAPRTGGH